MKEVEKKKSLNGCQKKRSVASERRDRKLQQDSGFKTSISKETDQKTLYSKPDLNISVGDSKAVTESSAAFQDMVIHYVDDTDRVEVASQDLNTEEMVVNENKDELNDQSVFLDKEQCLRKKEEESDSETGKDLASYKGDAIAAENEKFERPSTAPARPGKNGISKSGSQSSRLISDRATSMLQSGAPNKIKKGTKSMKGSLKETANNTRGKNSTQLKFPSQPSSKFSENRNEKPLDDVKEVDILKEFSNGADTAGSDVDTVNSEENGSCNGREDVDPRIEEMESRIEKLEEELREIAVLEISLYSAISEHGSSAHKMHTPARRLSRLYIHACKYWSQDKRATFSRNTVSGLVLVSKSCSNDVPRLTFWLSNTVVLRENISQTFGSSCNTNSISRISELNGDVRKIDVNSLSLKWKGGPGNTRDRKHGLIQFMDDWQETRTFTAALENIESWIFSRIVESIWWQTFTPNMQSTLLDSHTKVIGRLLGPALGDQQQGKFSINHWNNAYRDASRRLCPVRAGGHECGCLPVLARMVIEQCVSRLDVAMFNAILRESAHEIPTDPVSDPIVDSKVLPIPAGDLSFGSGAQLKNSVGNWSRSLFELFGTSADCSSRQDYNDNDTCGEDERKHFNLLNSLSDLLMLPKDMLLDSSIRKQVCPSISLPLVRRILCNFTPDEFCPDPVPGAILEAVNTECILEQRLSRDASSSFPYNAAPVVYTPPSLPNIAEKVVEAGGKSQLARNASVLQRKGYTSDEELDELDLPLTSTIDNLRSPCDVLANGNQKSEEQTCKVCRNARYKLLREVW